LYKNVHTQFKIESKLESRGDKKKTFFFYFRRLRIEWLFQSGCIDSGSKFGLEAAKFEF
jgi:hypothetical protein